MQSPFSYQAGSRRVEESKGTSTIMWRIEIIDNRDGEYPGRVRASRVSNLPEKTDLRRQDQFAVMTRISLLGLPPASSSALCGCCRRKKLLTDHILRQK